MKTKPNANITALLKQAYAAELETVANDLANSVWLDGLQAREVAESLAEEVTEELGHATRLARRLKTTGRLPAWFAGVAAHAEGAPAAEGLDRRARGGRRRAGRRKRGY